MPVAFSVALTVAPATAAPDGSVTVPLIAPRNVWLFAVTTTRSANNTADNHRFIYSPLARSNSYQVARKKPTTPSNAKKPTCVEQVASALDKNVKQTKEMPHSPYWPLVGDTLRPRGAECQFKSLNM